MKTILCLILLLGSSFRFNDNCLQLDLILIGDLSGSVQGKENFVSEAFFSLIEENDIDENFKVGIIIFNDDPTLISILSSDSERLKKDVLSIRTRRALGGTILSTTLQMSLIQFMNYGNVNHKKMIILVTDGSIDDKYETSLTIMKLKQLGVIICGVMISDGVSNVEFFKLACGECYVESNYANLIQEIKKLDVCL